MIKEKNFLTPQQQEFLKNYLDIKSESFGNALQSALKAKYSQEYAENLTDQMPKWLSENLGDAKRIKKAEENIDEMLDMDIINKGITKNGKEIYEFDDVGKLRVKADITKFTLEKLNRKKYGQERPNPIVPIQINFNSDKEEFK